MILMKIEEFNTGKEWNWIVQSMNPRAYLLFSRKKKKVKNIFYMSGKIEGYC